MYLLKIRLIGRQVNFSVTYVAGERAYPRLWTGIGSVKNQRQADKRRLTTVTKGLSTNCIARVEDDRLGG